MKTVNISLYSFDELSPEIQNKVLENYRIYYVEFDEWYQFVTDNWTTKLEALGFNDIDISFSGFGSQGDGASFTAKSIDFEKLFAAENFDEFAKPEKYARLLKLMKAGKIEITGYINRPNYPRYVHEYTTNSDTNLWINYETKDRKYPRIKALYLEIEEDLNNAILSLNREIYKDLENEYEGLTSDETIKEVMREYSWQFESDGTRRADFED